MGLELICILLFLVTGCTSVDIVFDNQLETVESEQDGYDLEKELSALSTVKFKGSYDKDSSSVVCEIQSPDIYSFLMDNMDSMMELDENELYIKIIEYAQKKDCPTRKVEVELPAHFENEKLVVETDSFEYQDAVTGGVNSALTEIYLKALEEMQ